MTNYPPDRHGVILPLKICVGITSCLSIIGGFLIVLTFCWRVCSSQRQSRRPHAHGGQTESFRSAMLGPARLILVNLSIADILVAGSHLWGVAAGYDAYFQNNTSDALGSTDTQCDVQGAMAVYGTIASFLWTVTFSFFLVLTMALSQPQRFGSLGAIMVYILVCWGIPAVVLTVIAIRKQFGLQYDVTIAWCYILPRNHVQNIFINIIAYDMWSYLSISLLLLFFIVAVCYNCKKSKLSRNEASETSHLINHNTANANIARPLNQTKLIYVALILVVLRMWDAIYVSLGYSPHYDSNIEDSNWIVVLLFLAGIGNSAQGFANAILFLLCTKTYRRWIIDNLTSCCCCRQRNNTELN